MIMTKNKEEGDHNYDNYDDEDERRDIAMRRKKVCKHLE